jgi:hypothetical protein
MPENQTDDFWPAIDEAEEITAPIVLLRKYAAPLWDKSGHLINAEVETRTGSEGSFIHSFNLIVPALDGYTYELFEVRHGIEPYPVWYLDEDRQRSEFADEKQFTDWIKVMLSSERTKRILKTLVQQVRR